MKCLKMVSAWRVICACVYTFFLLKKNYIIRFVDYFTDSLGHIKINMQITVCVDYKIMVIRRGKC